jgi:hypothetical protein
MDRITEDALKVLFAHRLKAGERFWVDGREATTPAEIIEGIEKGWRVVSSNQGNI